jgi:hypothetical protein
MVSTILANLEGCQERVLAGRLLQANGLKANISIKPSSLGLLLDMQQCERLAERILEAAEGHKNSVCIDMCVIAWT